MPNRLTFAKTLVFTATTHGIVSAVKRISLTGSELRMNKIEVVVEPWNLDAFKKAATRPGIAQFCLVGVQYSGCTTIKCQKRFCRGHQYTADLLPRLKVDFELLDDAVKETLCELLGLVQPASITVLEADEALCAVNRHLGNFLNARPVKRASANRDCTHSKLPAVQLGSEVAHRSQ